MSEKCRGIFFDSHCSYLQSSPPLGSLGACLMLQQMKPVCLSVSQCVSLSTGTTPSQVEYLKNNFTAD